LNIVGAAFPLQAKFFFTDKRFEKSHFYLSAKKFIVDGSTGQLVQTPYFLKVAPDMNKLQHKFT
jgi:hypothetical protein